MSSTTPGPRRKIAGERPRRTAPAATREAETSAPPAGPPPPPLPRDVAKTADGDHERSTLRTLADRTLADRLPADRLLVGLAVVLAAVIAFDVIMAVRGDQQASLVSSQTEAISAAYNTAPAQAEKAAVQMLSYDYTSLEQDATKAKTFMTPDYAATFQKTVDKLLTTPATQVKAQVTAKVLASGVASAAPNQVDVLLFVDQTSVTTVNAEPQTALNRVVFTMVKSGDRWLVDEVTAL